MKACSMIPCLRPPSASGHTGQLPVPKAALRFGVYGGGRKIGTTNTEPQRYSRNMTGVYLPGSLYSDYVPTIFLGLPVWGSHFTPFIGFGLRGFYKKHLRKQKQKEKQGPTEAPTSV